MCQRGAKNKNKKVYKKKKEHMSCGIKSAYTYTYVTISSQVRRRPFRFIFYVGYQYVPVDLLGAKGRGVLLESGKRPLVLVYRFFSICKFIYDSLPEKND